MKLEGVSPAGLWGGVLAPHTVHGSCILIHPGPGQPLSISPGADAWVCRPGMQHPRARGERQGQRRRWGSQGGRTRGLFVGKHGVTAGCLLLRKMLSSLMAPRSNEQRSSVPDGERECVRGNLQLFQLEKRCNTGGDYFTD